MPKDFSPNMIHGTNFTLRINDYQSCGVKGCPTCNGTERKHGPYAVLNHRKKARKLHRLGVMHVPSEYFYWIDKKFANLPPSKIEIAGLALRLFVISSILKEQGLDYSREMALMMMMVNWREVNGTSLQEAISTANAIVKSRSPVVWHKTDSN